MSGTMWIRYRGRTAMVTEQEFEPLVRAGLVPPEAWVVSAAWTRGRPVQARDMEIYHLWRPDPEDEDQIPATRHSPIDEIYFRRRFSLTLVFIALNLLVALLLLVDWGREAYPYVLREWARDMKLSVRGWWDAYHLIQPVFVHANPRHLFGNMLYLFAFGAIVEYCLGVWRLAAVYLLAGLGGAIASLLFLDHPGVSVGASGAIFGTIGATIVYLIKHNREFHLRLRWRTRRVFIPMAVAVAVFSLSSGNLWAHGGGLVTGAVVGLMLDRPLPDPPQDADAGPDGAIPVHSKGIQ